MFEKGVSHFIFELHDELFGVDGHHWVGGLFQHFFMILVEPFGILIDFVEKDSDIGRVKHAASFLVFSDELEWYRDPIHSHVEYESVSRKQTNSRA